MPSALRSDQTTTLVAVENVTVTLAPQSKQQLKALAERDGITLVTLYKRAIMTLATALREDRSGSLTMSPTIKPASGVRLQLLLDETTSRAVRRIADRLSVTRRVVCYSALLHYLQERSRMP